MKSSLEHHPRRLQRCQSQLPTSSWHNCYFSYVKKPQQFPNKITSNARHSAGKKKRKPTQTQTKPTHSRRRVKTIISTNFQVIISQGDTACQAQPCHNVPSPAAANGSWQPLSWAGDRALPTLGANTELRGVHSMAKGWNFTLSPAHSSFSWLHLEQQLRFGLCVCV